MRFEPAAPRRRFGHIESLAPKRREAFYVSTYLLPIIYVIRNYRSLFPAVLEIGTYENYTVL